MLGDCSSDGCKALPLFRFDLFWVLVGCMLELKAVETGSFLVTYLGFEKVNTTCSKLLGSGFVFCFDTWFLFRSAEICRFTAFWRPPPHQWYYDSKPCRHCVKHDEVSNMVYMIWSA
jgi:hypothetical protein